MGHRARSSRLRLAGSLAVGLVLVACSDDEAPEVAPPTPDEEAADDPVGDGVDEEDLGDPGDDGDLADEDDLAAGDAPDGVDAEFDVDVSESHPNGVVVQVSRVITTGNTIELEVEIINSSPDLRQLHDVDNTVRQLMVGDDLDNIYPFSGAAGETELVIEGNETLEGRLVFIGRLDPDATLIGLGVAGGEQEQAPNSPWADMTILIDLPDR